MFCQAMFKIYFIGGLILRMEKYCAIFPVLFLQCLHDIAGFAKSRNGFVCAIVAELVDA